MWFAFKIVSLTYFIHRSKICKEASARCDLLSKLYLWLTSYINIHLRNNAYCVVICFQNCIFDLLHTSPIFGADYNDELWFAFKIVSLTYFIHLKTLCNTNQRGCDLLSKLYLWLTSYICRYNSSLCDIVVICFQNCIFDLLHTSFDDIFLNEKELWFAFKIVSLTYFIHQNLF